MADENDAFREPTEETKAKNRITGYIFGAIVFVLVFGAMVLRSCANAQ